MFALLDVNGIVFVMQMFRNLAQSMYSCERSFTLATRTLVYLNSDVSVKFSECLILLNSIITIFCKKKNILLIYPSIPINIINIETNIW